MHDFYVNGIESPVNLFCYIIKCLSESDNFVSLLLGFNLLITEEILLIMLSLRVDVFADSSYLWLELNVGFCS